MSKMCAIFDHAQKKSFPSEIVQNWRISQPTPVLSGKIKLGMGYLTL